MKNLWLFVPSVLLAVAALIATIISKLRQRRRKGTQDDAVVAPGNLAPVPVESKRLPKVVELSNHGAHLLAEVERQRKASEELINKHKTILEELSIEEAKVRAGLNGEAALDDFLRDHLDDKWIIIAGYRAPSGEIDRILVGPNGVFAFEVKNLGGIIHCDGDRWWRDKIDGHGNVVKQGIPIADNGGRSPSSQINKSADALQRMIMKNGYNEVKVIRVVVFTHPRAMFGTIKDLSVHLLAKVPGMDVERLLSFGTPLVRERVFQIVTTIRRHHEWFVSASNNVLQAASLVRNKPCRLRAVRGRAGIGNARSIHERKHFDKSPIYHHCVSISKIIRIDSNEFEAHIGGIALRIGIGSLIKSILNSSKGVKHEA